MAVKNILIAAVSIYAVLAALVYFFNPKLVYFPGRRLTATPADAGLDYEDSRFRTEDGLTLHGWFVPADSARGTVLFCHGNAGNISGRVDLCRMLHGLRLNVFMFDYRGYGESEGSPSEEGTYRDVAGAWTYLTDERNIPPETIAVYGRSLGGPVAAWCAANRDPGTLILHATFTSVPEMAKTIYPAFLVALLPLRIKYPTATYLEDVSAPTLIVHSAHDDLVPVRFGKELYAIAAQPKSFLGLSGGHNDDIYVSEEKFLDGLDLFFTGHFPADSK